MPPKSDDIVDSLRDVVPLIAPKMFYQECDGEKIVYRELPEKIPELSLDSAVSSFDYTSCWGIPKADDSGPRIDCSGSITTAAGNLVYSTTTTGTSSNHVIGTLFDKPDFINTTIDVDSTRVNEFHDLVAKAVSELNDLYMSRRKDTKEMNDVLVVKKLPTDEKKDEGKKIIMPGIGSGFQYAVDRIVINPPALVVFWKDKTKTIVKCSEGETFNPYYGFCAALAKKVYGCNSRVNKIVKDAALEYDKMQAKKAKAVTATKKENKVETQKDKPVKKLQTKTKTAKKGTAKK